MRHACVRCVGTPFDGLDESSANGAVAYMGMASMRALPTVHSMCPTYAYTHAHTLVYPRVYTRVCAHVHTQARAPTAQVGVP